MSTARQRALLTPCPFGLGVQGGLARRLQVAHPVDYLTSCSKHCEHACQQRVSVHYLLHVPSDLECRVAVLAVCRVAHPVDSPCPFGLGVQGGLARHLQGRPPC